MKKFLLLLWVCLLTLSLYAQNGTRNSVQNNSSENSTHVTAAQALEIGYTFMHTGNQVRGNGTASVNVNKQTMQLVYTGIATDSLTRAVTDCYYVFSLQPTGFVIVSADERAEPILGYSYDNNFVLEGMPDNVRYWLDHYVKQIYAAVSNGCESSPEITEKWTLLRSGQPMPTRSITAVSPLIQTSWNQGIYYNQMCPADSNDADGHVPAGCVATAMAQIIRYWEWPNQGINSHSYNSNYGTLSVDFSSATYTYNNMPNALSSSSSSSQINEVAQLMYHCGVAVDMEYTCGGSGAVMESVPYALYNYFAYINNGTYVERSNYSDNDWENLIRQELNNARPVLVSGRGVGSHAFICDGYDNYGAFHFNWGWGGSCNDAYYTLDALTPCNHDYSYDQEAIIGISATGAFIRVSDNTMSFYASVGSESEVKLLSVRGHSLSSNISVTAGNGFVVSSNGNNFYNSVSLPSLGGNLYVKYLSTSTNNMTQSMTLSSGSTSASVMLYGTSFLTGQPCLGNETVSDYDGNIYNTVQIGSQCWMKENLRVTHYEDGEEIPMGPGESYENAFRFSPGYSVENTPTHGYLYNWAAVMRKMPASNNNLSNVQGICPSGWHVPSKTEWSYLIDYVKGLSDYWCEGSNNNYAKALASNTYWDSSTANCAVGNNQSSNNTTGFSAVPAGYCLYGRYVSDFGSNACYWTATALSSNPFAWYVNFNYANAGVAVENGYGSSFMKVSGFSVRCVLGAGNNLSTVYTNEASGITLNSATCGGNVTYDGNTTVTARGVCWSTSPNPTIDDNHTTDGSGTGFFTSSLTGLTANTTYYVRAYATNSVGTVYGNEVSFVADNSILTSDAHPCPGVATVTDYDGNVYNTVKIGLQCWMKENLRVTHYADGVSLSLGESYSYDSPLYYENGNVNVLQNGLYYNWPAVMHGMESSDASPSGIQGICPNGWHLPSNAEWNQLIDYVRSVPAYVCDCDTGSIGKALASNSGWATYNSTCQIANSTMYNNLTGFSAYPAGISAGLTYAGIDSVTAFCSATEWERGLGLHAYFLLLQADCSVQCAATYKAMGASVRCVLGDGVNFPAVTTNEASLITLNSATCGGNVTYDGNTTITARGVCWSTSPNPTIDDNHTTDGSGMGSFTSSLTGLSAYTTYYVRAYATNSAGTVYGNEVSFVAENSIPAGDAQPCPGVATVTDYDGNVYNTVKIGQQCWMKENLRVEHYEDGIAIPVGTSYYQNTPARFNPNNDASSVSTYGYLYNWYAAMHGITGSSENPSNVQGICPAGWHMPSYAEWNQLFTYVRNVPLYVCDMGDNCNDHIAKSLAGTEGWTISEEECAVGNNQSSNNATGFSAIPVGERANFWATDANAEAVILYYFGANIWRTNNSKIGRFSIRCVLGTGFDLYVTTNSINSVTQSSASCGGVVTYSGDLPITSRGVCWSTSQNPTVDDFHTSDGSGTGSFTSSLTGLIPNTTYYVRAYVTNGSIMCYGEEITFTTSCNTVNVSIAGTTTISYGGSTTLTASGANTYSWNTGNSNANITVSPSATTSYTVTGTNSYGCTGTASVTVTVNYNKPTVTTSSVSNITATTAKCGGEVTADGGATITARGVCWSTSQNPTVSGSHTTNGSGTGSFTSSITGLTPNTKYYVRAYATNSAGTSYGAQKTFTTSCNTVNVSIAGTTTINYGDNTTLTASGANSYSWSTGGNSANITVSPTATTTYTVTGTNQYGCTGTASVTVTVNYLNPTVTTNSVTNIAATTASCGGNVTADGGTTVTARGVCWSTSQNPTVSGSHTTNSSGTGSFTSSITGLTPNTTYYVRAYATNSIGTAYGNEISFTTSNCSDIYLPFVEDFESYTASTTASTGVQPNCWELVREDVAMTEANRPQLYYKNSYAHSGSYSLLLNYRGIYAMPALSENMPMNNVKLEMYLRQPKAAYQLEVGVYEDDGTFVPVTTFNNSGTGVELVECDFSAYTGNGHRIAFRNILGGGANYNYSYNYIDDIVLTSICDPIPFPYTETFESYTASTTASTGVQPDCWSLVREDVAMTEANRPQLYYKSSFAHSGKYSLLLNYRGVYAMPALSEDVPINNVKLEMYLRQPKATYQLEVGVYEYDGTFVPVATFNNSGTGVEFVTCDFSSYTGNGRRIAFHNVLGGGANYNYSYNYLDDIVLTYLCEPIVPPYSEDFESYTASTTVSTGVQPDCWELVQADVAMTDATQPQLYYKSSFAHSGNYSLKMGYRGVYAMPALSGEVPMNNVKLEMYLRQPNAAYQLEVGVWDGQAFVPVRRINNSTTEVEHVVCDFSTYTGNGHRIAFRNVLGGGANYSYSYNYIDDIVLTVCNPISLPYAEDFESLTESTTASTGVEPDCWDLVREDVAMTDATRPQLYYKSSYAHSGNYSLKMGYRGIYAMPALSEEVPMNNVRLEMYLRQPNAAYRLEVGVWDDMTQTFEVVKLFNNSTTNVEHVTCDFSSYNGSGRRIAFRNVLGGGANYNYSYNYIDDIILTEMEDCTITLPYSENFDSYTTSTTAATGVKPECWELVQEDVSMTDAKRPQIYYKSDYAHSGSYSLMMAYRGIYAMPALSSGIPMNQVSLKMYLRQSNAAYRLQVGVWEDDGTFVPVALFNNSGTGVQYVECVFSGYNGNGRRIAFRNVLGGGANYAYSYNYLDDITLSYTDNARNAANENNFNGTGIGRLLESVTVYPNPTKDYVNVQCTMNDVHCSGIEVIDMYGKVIYTVVETMCTSSLPTRINVSNLAAGMYFVRVTTDQGTVTKTFVKR